MGEEIFPASAGRDEVRSHTKRWKWVLSNEWREGQISHRYVSHQKAKRERAREMEAIAGRLCRAERSSRARLKYEMTDYWTGEPLAIDDKIFLATTWPPFGGLRWWFVCPHLNRRVRKLYLPLGGRHFWSRRAYELATPPNNPAPGNTEALPANPWGRRPVARAPLVGAVKALAYSSAAI
jgi:hypothetical protein